MGRYVALFGHIILYLNPISLRSSEKQQIPIVWSLVSPDMTLQNRHNILYAHYQEVRTNKMKNKEIYHTAGTIPTSNQKVVETVAK